MFRSRSTVLQTVRLKEGLFFRYITSATSEKLCLGWRWPSIEQIDDCC